MSAEYWRKLQRDKAGTVVRSGHLAFDPLGQPIRVGRSVHFTAYRKVRTGVVATVGREYLHIHYTTREGGPSRVTIRSPKEVYVT